MPSDSDIDFTKVTFSQAEGLEPLPQRLELGDISSRTRSLLWNLFFTHLKGASQSDLMEPPYLPDGPWKSILQTWHIAVCNLPADEYSSNLVRNIEMVKKLILHGTYNEVFDFIQFVLRDRDCPYNFINQIKSILEFTLTAYAVLDEGPTIIPAVLEEEGQALRDAFVAVKKSGLEGARTHFRTAAEELNSGDFASSVRESIHAVESVAKTLDPTSNTLTPALKALSEKVEIHPALTGAFSSMYGYTSDEKGIRHALLEDEAKVDIDDAVFMIGACSSFVTYLIANGRKAGLIK